MSNHAQDNAYAHCKACDNNFFPHYRGKEQGYEDLCPTCLNIAEQAARSEFVFKEIDDIMLFKGSRVSDSLHSECDYLSGGESSMGNLNLWEKV